jgi:Tfp pilus assembly protein PilF
MRKIYFYLNSTYIRINAKDFENAKKALLKTIAMNPKHSRAKNYQGIKLNESEAFTRKAVTLEPKNGAYLNSPGRFFCKQGKFDAA